MLGLTFVHTTLIQFEYQLLTRLCLVPEDTAMNRMENVSALI